MNLPPIVKKLYTLPNLPADIVPIGKTPEENLNVLKRRNSSFA
jgi:seryl-tRNA synthetase